MRTVLTFAVLALVGSVVAANVANTTLRARKETVAAALPPAQAEPVPRGGRIVTVRGDQGGNFHVAGRIDGRRAEFLVDTGATVVALRESEAARLGIRPLPRDFTAEVKTANGSGKAAPVMLGSVDIDGVVVRDVRAIVMADEALPVNLLGMTYLSRVRFSHERGQLVIEQ